MALSEIECFINLAEDYLRSGYYRQREEKPKLPFAYITAEEPADELIEESADFLRREIRGSFT